MLAEATELLANSLAPTASACIWSAVIQSVAPSVIKVPVSLGIVIVLSAVGSVTTISVSCASSVAPSNIIFLPAFTDILPVP